MRTSIALSTLVAASLALTLPALSVEVGKMRAEGVQLPYLGTYGARDPRWDGCDDAKREREGYYVVIRARTIFNGNSECKVLRWERPNRTDDNYDVTQVCGSGERPFTARYTLTQDALMLKGRVYRRCAM